jgi:hypothetical protein
MKTFAFAAAALVIAAGSAFARGGGSDHFEPFSELPPVSGIDGSHTESLKKLTHTMTQSPASKTTSPYNPADDYGRGIWGR